jgi:Zn-dependent M28 family amino/carboxypeptidase
VLVPVATQHDLRLFLFGGEEQGLHGSRIHVSGLTVDALQRITMVVHMDMIGRLNISAPSVLLEGAPVSQSVIDTLAQAATTLRTWRSWYPFSPLLLTTCPSSTPGFLLY